MATTELSDTELIAAVVNGQTAHFTVLVRRYEHTVAQTVTGMLGRSAKNVNNADEVEEVAQEVFVRFFHALPTFRGDASVSTYLTRIAINCSLNALKRRKRRKWLSFFDNNDLERIESPNTHTTDDSEVIEHALQRLKPALREVVVLRLVNGYSTEETAKILTIPVGTVLSRLSTARAQLRAALSPYFGERYE